MFTLMTKFAIFVAIAIMAGCAGSTAKIATLSEAELQKESSVNLCNAYHFQKVKSAKDELIRRKEFSDKTWISIENGAIFIGMSEVGLVCAMGGPIRVNLTVTKEGESKQFVYGSRTYVYTQNGFITSWQK